MKKIIFLFLLVLVAINAHTQAVFNIQPSPNDPTISPYLLGIGRNHYIGNTLVGDPTSDYKENKLTEKISLVGAIANPSTNGLVTNTRRKVYRLGHSPTEGESRFGDETYGNGTRSAQPGWHWATDYKHKGDIKSVLVLNPSSYQATTTELLGAGVHRYFFEAKYGERYTSTINAGTLLLREESTTGVIADFTSPHTIPTTGKSYYFSFHSNSQKIYEINIGNITGGSVNMQVEYYNQSNSIITSYVKNSINGNPDAFCVIAPANTAHLRIKLIGSSSTVQLEKLTLEGLKRYSGQTVTFNYQNDINFNNITCPPSKTVYLLTDKSTYKMVDSQLDKPVADPNQYVIRQISGPIKDEELKRGSYLVEFRITQKSNGSNYGDLDVGYCGYVVSINEPSENIKLVRTGGDIRETITGYNVPSAATAAEILAAHRKTAIIKFPKLVNNANKNENTVDASVVPGALGTNLQATQNVVIARYDNLIEYLNEADTLKADLALVINVSSGFPEEAVGLLRYLKALNKNIAYAELGNETMGTWQKGNHDFEGDANLGNDSWRTHVGIGRLTIPFAKLIKTTSLNNINQVKLTATSSYRLLSPFADEPTSYQNLANEWLNALSDNNTCYVDYLNFHSYTNNEVSIFSGTTIPDLRLKLNHSLAVFNLFENEIIPQMQAGIGNRPVGMLISEGHFGDKADESKTPLAWAAQINMIQGINYAETFRIAASNKFYALTPFALLKPNKNPGQDNWVSGTLPTDPNVIPGDTDDYDILFYYNSAKSGLAHKKDIIYMKPTFRIMQMLGTSLGSKLVTTVNKSGVPTITGNTLFPYDILPVQNRNFDAISILPTKTGGDTLQVMIINKNSPTQESALEYNEITLQVNGTPVMGGSIKYIAATSLVDKDPVASPSTNVNGNFATTSGFAAPKTNAFTLGGGRINIPKLSVCIVTIPNMSSSPRSSINDVTVIENDGIATMTITSNTALPSTINIPITYSNITAQSGSDYSSTVATVEMLGGFTTQPFTIGIVNNQTAETLLETFKVQLGTVAGVQIEDGEGIVTIQDDDDPTSGNCNAVTITPMAGMVKIQNLNNNGNSIRIKVERIVPSYAYIGETFHTSPPTSTLTLPSSGTYANGTYQVKVRYYTTNSSSATLCEKIDTIVIGNTVGFSIENAIVNEYTNTAFVKVKASPVPSSSLTVSYTTNNGTAMNGFDFTGVVNGTLNFASGDAEKLIAIPIINSSAFEPTESFTVNLSNPSPGASITTGTATVTILDDDPECTNNIMITNFVTGITVSGLNSKKTEIKVQNPNGTFDATITVTGQNTYNITKVPGTYFVNYKIFNSANQVTCMGTEQVNVLPKLDILDKTVNEGAGTVQVTVQSNSAGLNNSAITFKYGSVEGTAKDTVDYIKSTNQTGTIAAGNTSVTLTFSIVNDNLAEPTESFMVILDDPINAEIGDESATITIQDNDGLPTLSIADITVNENVGNANAIISLSAPHNVAVTVSYATQQVTTSALSNSDFTPINTNVTIPAGATSATTSIAIVNDAVTEPQEYFNVHLSTSSGLAITDGVGTVTIVDNDGSLCDNITISTGAGVINVGNLNQSGAVHCQIQVIGTSGTIHNVTYNSPIPSTTQSFPVSAGGTYTVKIKYFNSSWGQVCSKDYTVTVPNSQGNNTNAVTIGEISKSAPSTPEVVLSESKHKKALLYPNPTSGKFYLNVEGFEGKLLTIQLIDQYGRALQVEKMVYLDDLEMNIGNHPDGTYFLQIFAENEQPIVERILLQSASIHTQRQ